MTRRSVDEGIAAMAIFTGLALGPSAGTARAQAGGVIAGTARSEAGQALAGAIVSIHVRPTGTDTRPFDARATTGPDGAYRFTGVPPGRYIVCGQVPNSGLINSCAWQNSPPVVVNLAPGQSASANVTLMQGYKLQLRLDDPGGALSAAKDDPNLFGIFLAISGGAPGFMPLLPSKTDARGRDYEVYVPYGVPLKVTAQSGRFELADEAGARLASTGQVRDVTIARGSSQPVITVRVTGGRR